MILTFRYFFTKMLLNLKNKTFTIRILKLTTFAVIVW